MRIARTLSLYVMGEALLYCALSFFVLTLVLLTQSLLRRLDQLYLVGMTPRDLWVVVECSFPVALSYSIPLAFLIGILLSVRRLSADGEIRGMGASGIGPTTFLVPHLILGLVASGVSGWLLATVEHESRRELVQLFKTVAARGAILEPGKFRTIGRRIVFVEDRDRSGTLSGVMIVDTNRNGQPYRVFADRGRFRFDEARAEIELELWNGDLHFAPSEEDPKRYARIHFDSIAYALPVGHILRGDFGPVRPKQMNVAELRSVMARARAGDPLRELDQRDPLEYALELHRRRTLPFAPLLFAGVAVPVALASEDRGRNRGLFLVLLAAFGYYALSAAMAAAAAGPWLSPGVASWIPNGVFAALAVALAVREQRRIPS